ncbi:right-handed parallel beta-helix repeat-containing protein [Amnibacterium kyonggiense]|uniref:Parallel beta-helix repeat protein n=1 Tax=Amnibacterium kyonggiense TaxID=595671 RepID=A0A4R7FDD3_9MICO|nr:right-handed parallel beta-helix repeat-containing protein [Amnibacterium kyonggiense]TDS74969.1 parallel beta-helix repeat protein [Amnibacterium kyonggiense]
MIAAVTAALIGGSAAPAVAAPADTGAVVTGTTYYVNCAAKKNGFGTATSPWASLWAVNTHGRFSAGDVIRFKKGTTCTGKLTPKGSGAAGAPITIGSYGSGAKPTIAGGGTGMETATITLKNQAYWTIQDLHVTNRSKAAATTAFRSGVLLLNDNGGYLFGMTLQRLTVDNVTSKLYYQNGHDARDWGGISVHTVRRGGGDGFTGLRIMNNVVSGVGRTGIVTSNREYPNGLDLGLRIAGNTVSKSRGDGIIMRGARNASIDHNTVKNNSNMWPCPQCMKARGMGANAGIWPTWSSDSVIEKNNVYGTHVGHGDGEGIDLDIMAERIIVQYNWVHDNDGGGVLFCGSKSSTVRFNIFENNKKSAIAFIGTVPAKDSSVYNNTMYAAKSVNAGNVRTFNGLHGSGIKFYNNLVYNYGSAYWTFPTKVWARSNTIVGVHGRGEPKGAGTSRTDPKLKNPGVGATSFSSLGGYKPRYPSKMPRGIAIPASAKVDFFGKKIDAKKPPRGAAG